MLNALADTVRAKLRNHRRPEIENFIRQYTFPSGLRSKLTAHLPGVTEQRIEDVLLGLKEYFALYLDAEGFKLGMPSKAVDAAWHEFILYTRDYTAFCERAFGFYLHHIPDDPQSPSYDPIRDLGRTWIWHCIQNGEDPRFPREVPRLFAIDADLGLTEARIYTLEDLAALPVPPSFIETEPGRYRYIGDRPKRRAYWIGSPGSYRGWFGYTDISGNASSGVYGINHGGGHHGCGGGHGGGHGCSGGSGCSGGGGGCGGGGGH